MISVGSRDERKGLSLRYLFEGEKMEFESEFEDGEANFQKNNTFGNDYDDYYDDDDSGMDPDVSLSYIDEKIQDVLGHCQKDFEGGVSAEKLGPKFGGYGSFLPSYHRSPVCTNPKTPPKVLTYSAPVSPNNAHKEVGYQNPVPQSSASKPARHRPASFSAGSGSTRKGSTSNRKSKSRSVSSSANDSDQQSLKVRIKLGTDNMLPKSKAEIYSGLGLDISPSSSLEASPVNSSGFFHPDESPTSILEMMTSFPVSGSVLLSPLPYDVLHLTEKKMEVNSCEPVHKGSQESTVTALHGSDLLKVDQNILGEKLKSKSTEKNSASMESTNGDEFRNGISVKKETSMDNFAPGNKASTSSGKRKSEGGVKNTSLTSKTKNNSHGSKSYNDDFKKNRVKVEETYKGFFGDLDLDHDEIGLEKPSEGINVKSTLDDSSISKKKINGKKSQKPSSVYTKADSHVPITDNGVESAVGAPAVVPLVNEDWVCCDKCEKWRLLPPGLNPGILPEKWLCSMLDWLPGMNRCNISEEETTKAITSLFPGPSIQGSQPLHLVGPELGVVTLDSSYPDGSHQSFSLKRKHGLKNLPNEAKPSLSSNSLKKNAHTSYKTRSLNDVIQSPLVNEVDFQDSGQSRDVIVEKDRIKQKENNAYEGNNIRHSKIGVKRESTQDFTRDYKKVKTDKNDGKLDKGDVTKKRKKVNEINDTGKYVKETSEASRRKEKKARVLKSFDEGKESKSKNIEDSTKISSRRDTVLAATSSSSKVSGSRKMKNNNQETKGSPVESVSSSPMRIMNAKVVDFDQSLAKNEDTRTNEEKSEGGRNGTQGKFVKGSASKKLSLMKNVSQDSKIPIKKDVSRKGKSNSLPPRSQNEIERKENVGNDNNNNNILSKTLASNKKVQNQNGNQPVNVKDPSPNRYKGKELDPNVVLVRDLSNQATTDALREATKLKHMADRIKNAGSSLDSRALYMQAALKFLHSATLFESRHSKTGRYGDKIQSNSIYSSTIKLCEFCAQEYESTKEMTTAALAYKCMEVACMKVIYSSHATDCKAVNDLQTSLQVNPTGESPSSSASASASDLDNLNNAAAVDKAVLAKGVNNTSQVSRHHVIAAKNKPNFTRILSLAQESITAMNASKKSRICFAAASKQEAGLSEVKKALDFNFHDVEGFLHLVRVAMEIICR